MPKKLRSVFDSTITVYHGSKVKFNRDQFHHSFLVGGYDQRGPGLYTTTDEGEATTYGQYLHTIRLDISKFVKINERINRIIIQKLSKESPFIEDVATDWDENTKIGINKAIEAAIKYSPNMHEALERVWYDIYRHDNEKFLENVQYYYDGTTAKPNKFNSSTTHYIVWNPRAIKSIDIN